MLVAIPDTDRYFSLKLLRAGRDAARGAFFDHHDPGGMTNAEAQAWAMEHEALHLLLKAAQTRLDAEEELVRLLAAEQADAA